MVTIVIVSALMLVICMVISLLAIVYMTCMRLGLAFMCLGMVMTMSKNCRSGKIETERDDQRKQKAIKLLHERSPSMQMEVGAQKRSKRVKISKLKMCQDSEMGGRSRKKPGSKKCVVRSALCSSMTY